MTNTRDLIKPLAILCIILLFAFLYPRLVVSVFGKESPWANYFYMYGNGLCVFVIGVMTILKSKACQLGRGHDNFWFAILLMGYVIFATFHGVWVLFALQTPFKGNL